MCSSDLIIGNQERVMTTIQCVFFVTNPTYFKTDNLDVFMLLEKKKFNEVKFDNIIESKIIIERSGEIFKKSLLSFNDDNGKTFSLRPDLTIAACLDYLKNKRKGFK